MREGTVWPEIERLVKIGGVASVAALVGGRSGQ